MRKGACITFLLLASLLHLEAAGGGLRPIYGIEYGYTSAISEWHHTNYLSPEGPRVNQIHTDFDYTPLGYFGIQSGLAFARHWSSSLLLSMHGISRERTIAALSLRIAYYLKSYDLDGIMFFLDGGAGITETFLGLPDVISKAGGAYRLMLSDRISMDICAAFQLSLDHPVNVTDRYSGIVLTQNSIRRSDAVYTGINIGLALNF